MLTKAGLPVANRAIYLPAITASYADFARNGAFKRSVAGLKPADLDFLDPANAYFHYPFALYSAGQVVPTPSSTPKTCMVAQRDRAKTIVLGDSGGYQVSTDAITFEGDTTTRRMMKWMEGVADWSMVLDFPTGGIAPGFVKDHITRLVGEGHDLQAMCKGNGQSLDFNACLRQTLINNDLFVAERAPGSTRFLNVLQGRNEAESKAWYEEVKHYPFEGWAFAGAHQNHFSLLLRRLVDMHHDGLLAKCGWLHVLGVSTLEVGCLLTKVQRGVREHWGYSDFQISFDSASPFISAAKNNMIIGHTLDPYGWAVRTANVAKIAAVDVRKAMNTFCHEKLTRKRRPVPREMFPAFRRLGEALTMADIWSDGISNLDVSKSGRTKPDLDRDGSFLLMQHNTQAFIQAHDRAHEAFFDEKDWRVPLDAKVIAGAIDVLFGGAPSVTSTKSLVRVPLASRYAHIDEMEGWLDRLAA